MQKDSSAESQDMTAPSSSSTSSHQSLFPPSLFSNPIIYDEILRTLTQQIGSVQQQEPTPTTLPDSKELEQMIRQTILQRLPNKDAKMTIQGELKITVGSNPPIAVNFNPPPGRVSKRKAYTPVRILPAVPSSTGSASLDSGALDLSRPGSVHSTESSPMVPINPDHSRMLNSQYENHDFQGRMPTASTGRRRYNSQRKFSCNQCGETEFYSLQQLDEHTMQVHGTYRCQVCNRTFTQRSNLQRHALKHEGVKSFQCGVCSQGYYRKDYLMRHMNVKHPGINPSENIQVFSSSSSPPQSLENLNSAQTNVTNTSSVNSVVSGDEQASQ